MDAVVPHPAGPHRLAGSVLAPPRLALALAAMVDIALHARPQPVSAKALASRHALPPRHLEAVLQALVHHGLLKGLRGPHGGYELARERRRISAGDVARAVLGPDPAAEAAFSGSEVAGIVVAPLVAEAAGAYLAALDAVTVEDLCGRAEAAKVAGPRAGPDFTI
ncbi:Rrf2 family transcriptional regulator [Methylobacterium terricola]|uniref:Rrf2 family transcriptional regulator n=1 Tax=Methylobacterium terricola TaxID=2583531 RepID=A0A5C4LMT0_9HYPH|nr:Rrf2 family transcriptional regulator [Methylobacterium terricola]TNC15235.1 Rrf2 family transcriptional regulator [Methylobacterium terricola]